MGAIHKAATLTSESPALQSSQPRTRTIDTYIGNRIRVRRIFKGMSQNLLGEALELTLQQVQSYEHGLHRVGAVRLFDFSRVLDVPVSFFYDDTPESLPAQSSTHQTTPAASGLSEAQEDLDGDGGQSEAMNRHETVELARAYYRINDRSVRKRVLELIKSLEQSDLSPA